MSGRRLSDRWAGADLSTRSSRPRPRPAWRASTGGTVRPPLTASRSQRAGPGARAAPTRAATTFAPPRPRTSSLRSRAAWMRARRRPPRRPRRAGPPLGAADAGRRAEETLADDGTPVGLRFVITASCDAQENLSAVETPPQPRSLCGGAEPAGPALRPEFPTFETLEAAAASWRTHASFGDPIPSSSPHHESPSPGGAARARARASSASGARRLPRSGAARRRDSISDWAPHASGGGARSGAPAQGGHRAAPWRRGRAVRGRAGSGGPGAPPGARKRGGGVRLGACLFSAGKLDEAYARFARALELDPDHVPALQALGLLYQTRGALPEAARAYALASPPLLRRGRARRARTKPPPRRRARAWRRR